MSIGDWHMVCGTSDRWCSRYYQGRWQMTSHSSHITYDETQSQRPFRVLLPSTKEATIFCYYCRLHHPDIDLATLFSSPPPSNHPVLSCMSCMIPPPTTNTNKTTRYSSTHPRQSHTLHWRPASQAKRHCLLAFCNREPSAHCA